MKIKKIRASTQNELEKIIEKEFGPEAIILTTREVQEKGIFGLVNQKKIEATVAIEEIDYENFKKQSTKEEKLPNHESSKQHSLEPSFPTHTEKVSISSQARTLSQAHHAPSQTPPSSSLYSPSGKIQISPSKDSSASIHNNTVYSNEEIFTSKPTTSIKDSRTLTAKNIGESLSDFHRLSQRLISDFQNTKPKPKVDVEKTVREEMKRAQRSVPEPQEIIEKNKNNPVDQTVHFLIAKGVDRPIALRIDETLTQKLGKASAQVSQNQKINRINALKQELSNYIHCSGEIQLLPNHPTTIALIGPTGVGKTTSTMKIALYFSKTLGKKVGIIQVNSPHDQPIKEIRNLLTPLGITVRAETSLQGCRQAVEELQTHDIILIDTQGKNPCAKQEVGTLEPLIKKLSPHYTFLTLPATMKESDLYATIQQFNSLNFDSLLFTKLDETISLGTLVNICFHTKQPISYYCEGQDWMEGTLELAKSSKLAKRILTDKNSSEFKIARDLAYTD
jgi:flagellar biosynthesis protein FlhF